MFAEAAENRLVEKNICSDIRWHIRAKKHILVTYVVKHSVVRITCINIEKRTELLGLTNVKFVVGLLLNIMRV